MPGTPYTLVFAENSNGATNREGHEFIRAAKSLKLYRALAPEVCLLCPRVVFPQYSAAPLKYSNELRPSAIKELKT